jgi:hypothetical protein
MTETIGSILPALAEAISEWFPDLGGRVLPVLDTEITDDNMPTLPVCFLAFARERDGPRGTPRKPAPVEEFFIEFWYKPQRYAGSDGKQTPFWSFYDYAALRRKLVSHVYAWDAPSGGQLRYLTLEVEPTSYAAIFTFRFSHEFFMCLDEDEYAGDKFTITTSLCMPQGICTPEDTEQEQDPCKTK